MSVLSIIALSYLYENGSNLNKGLTEYSSPIIALYSVSIFSIFKRHERKYKCNKVISFLSGCSFGVYIIHMFWINICYKLLKANPFNIGNGIIGFCIVFISVMILSVLSSYILKKLPLLRRIL